MVFRPASPIETDVDRRRTAPSPGGLRPRRSAADRNRHGRHPHRHLARARRSAARSPCRSSTRTTSSNGWTTCTRPRPGHGDLTGAIKYLGSIRGVLERASARETTVRVAAGALAKQLLAPVRHHGVRLRRRTGRRQASSRSRGTLAEQRALRDASEIYTLDPGAGRRDQGADRRRPARRATRWAASSKCASKGLPFGLGTHAQWDRKLDGRLAQAVMAVQAIKGVEIGLGFEAARRPRLAGARSDSLRRQRKQSSPNLGYARPTNNAGGLEAGMTNGQPLVVRAAKKPISTLAQAAGIDQPRHQGARSGQLRAERRLRGAGGQRDRGERRGLRSRRGAGRQVRRRQPGGDAGPLEAVSRDGASKVAIADKYSPKYSPDTRQLLRPGEHGCSRCTKPRERRLCRGAFLALCLLPTTGVAVWCWVVHWPSYRTLARAGDGRAARLARRARSRHLAPAGRVCSTKVCRALRSRHRPPAGRGCRLSKSTSGPTRSAMRLPYPATVNGRGWSTLLRAAQRQLRAPGDWQRSRSSAERHGADAARRRPHAGRREWSHRACGRRLATGAAVSLATGQCQTAGRSDAGRADLRLPAQHDRPDRRCNSPRAVPCPAGWSRPAGRRRRGWVRRRTFTGRVSATEAEGRWRLELAGNLTRVDLERLMAPFPHRLTGTADVQIAQAVGARGPGRNGEGSTPRRPRRGQPLVDSVGTGTLAAGSARKKS